jgi:hypothetical protein
MRILVAVTVAQLGGCATVPDSGVRASGAPLRVDVQDKSFNALRSVEVGQVRYEDAGGRRVGTATITQNEMMRFSDVRWHGIQGDRVISDEDLFRIAGDSEAADVDHAYRRTGRIMFWTGCVMASAGLAGMLLVRDPSVLDTTGGQLAAVASYGGFLGGAMLIIFGRMRLDPDRHPVPLERAQQAVGQYNTQLRAAGPTISVVTVHGEF